jgi:Uma2 family endonuclease
MVPAEEHPMSAAPKKQLISVEDYLKGELASPIRHEYLGGYVYAMAGARNSHNLINDNAQVALALRLRGRSCRAHGSNTKVRIVLPKHIRFYYPDVSVTYDPNPPHDSFQDKPVAIVEVLSKSTRRVDEGEKKDAYLTIPSLAVYLLVEQYSPMVTVFRRAGTDFVRQVHEGMRAVIPLPELGIELPLADIYEGVDFIPEPTDEEDLR